MIHEPISEFIDSTKYRQAGETFEDKISRLANGLKDSDEHFHQIRDIMSDLRFLMAGRIQASVGTARKSTPFNCFVSGTLADNFVGTDGIMQRATEAAQTMRMGGGIGYDFSTLRPRGDLIASLDSASSGPLSFMQIFNALCETISASGHRRGAQMGVMRIDHPDIRDFITAKHNESNLRRFNLSVGITDEFMHAVQGGTDFPLRFDGREYSRVDARQLFEEIMRSTWDWGEPGVLFLDTINRTNNLWYCEDISATNPCAEQPLPPYGACLLGSFNLVRYLERSGDTWSFNFDQLRIDISPVVRAVDNVIDSAIYPLPAQEKEAKDKRRMGLGITGLANCVEACGFGYGSEGAVKLTQAILEIIRNGAYVASVKLAAEKGPFPLFDRDKYLEGAFVAKLPEAIRDWIRTRGIRNSHLISIAPTGTISLAANNISSGIEPVWQTEYTREIQTFDGSRTETIYDYGLKYLDTVPKSVGACTIDDHLNTLFASIPYVDSSISKTINVPRDTPWEDFKDIYFRVWKAGAKSCSTFTLDGKRKGIIKMETERAGESCRINVQSGIRTCDE